MLSTSHLLLPSSQEFGREMEQLQYYVIDRQREKRILHPLSCALQPMSDVEVVSCK
jgi:hypothetical protein